ncbi:helix-turn-helix domain-containing protein [Turicibacter sanguinis]|nr:helix-turn-helix domain-containing protein [Turicibacter sanguinis]MDB8576571.1 helix-turn-helix domain-containing protein [Turicibacter sanguinis]
MDFSNKESNQKLADYLREQRLNRSLNLDDVSDKIGVPIQHLKNIESGDFSRFDEFY